MILRDQPGYRNTLSRGLARVSTFLPLVEKKIGLRFGNDLWGDLFCSVIIEVIPFVLIFDIGVIMARICSVYQVSFNVGVKTKIFIFTQPPDEPQQHKGRTVVSNVRFLQFRPSNDPCRDLPEET